MGGFWGPPLPHFPQFIAPSGVFAVKRSVHPGNLAVDVLGPTSTDGKGGISRGPRPSNMVRIGLSRRGLLEETACNFALAHNI